MLRNRFLYLSSLVFVFTIPFFSLPMIGWDAESSKVALFVAWGTVMLVGGVVYAFKDKAWRNPFKVSLIGFSAILALLVLGCAALFSSVQRISFLGDGYAIGVPLFILIAIGIGYIISIFVEDKKRAGSMFLALVGGLALATTIAFLVMIIRRIFGLPDNIATFIFGLVGKWNDVGIYSIVLLISSMVAFRKFVLSGIGSIIAYIVFGLSLIMLATVNIILVWTGILVLSIVGLVYELIINKNKGIQHKRFVILTTITAVVALIFALDNHFGFMNGNVAAFATNVFNISSIEAYPSLSSTLDVAKGALSESALFGVGPGRFADAWRLYRPQEINLSQFWATDFTYGVGLWPTFLVTGGIFGVLGMFTFFIIVIFSAYRLYRSNEDNNMSVYINNVVATTVILLTLIFIIYSPGLGGSILYVMLVGMMAGLLSAQDKKLTFSINLFTKWNMAGLGILIIVLILSTGSLWTYGNKVYAAYHYNKAVKTPAVDLTNLPMTTEHLEKAFAADHRDIYARSVAAAYYAQFNAILVGGGAEYTAEQLQSMLNGVINISSNAIVANPYNSTNYIFVGELFRSLDAQGTSGAGDQSAAFYAKAIAYDPHNPLVRVLQARLALQDKDTKLAQERLEESIKLKPNYTEAVFLLSQILIDAGVSDDAIKKLEARASITPVEPIVFFQLGYLKYADKDYVGAIAALESAATLVPDYSNALYFLGLSYYYKDRDAEAIAVFERIAVLNPENKDVQNIIANMRLGKAPFSSASQAPENKSKLPVEEEAEADEE